MIATRPYTLIAELTYRCLLHCPYCSNPVEHAMDREGLDASIWELVIDDAAELGVVQLQLTGGEPLLYPDLERLVVRARSCELYTTLVTSGVPLERERLSVLVAYGLDHVQLSFQDADAAGSDVIAGTRAFERKLEVASWVKELEMPLTMNVVLHRANVGHVAELVELAAQIGADRLELVTTRYVGFAFANRDTLVPSRDQLERAHAAAGDARERLAGVMEVAFVEPSACTAIHVSPAGRVQGTDSVRDRTLAEIWQSCDRREETVPEPVPSHLLVSNALLRPRR
jgi:pyrroloquinoline quinone biosynthesis protein E